MRTKLGPSKNKFIQQTFPVKQLVYTTKCVMVVLSLIAIICFCIGGPMYNLAAGIQEFQFVYSNPGNTATCPDVGDLPCLNHRRFVSSRSDTMNRGDFGDESRPVNAFFSNSTVPDSAEGSCIGFDSYYVGGKKIVYYPCGLVAMSIFNDTFSLFRGSDGMKINLTTDGITWPVSDSKKYKSKDERWLRQNCFRFGGRDPNNRDFAFSGFPSSLSDFEGTLNASLSRYHCWHSLDSPELKVWSRTTITKNFWKINRIYHADLPAGSYEMLIDLRFPTASFGGQKGFVLTNANAAGGKSNTVALLFLALGGISAILTIGFGALSLFGPEPKKPFVKLPLATISNDQPTFTSSPFPPVYRSRRGKSATTEETEQRVVHFPIGDETFQTQFASNFVSTTKYTVFTFVPLNLMLQFQRFANVYFLIVAVLASIQQISPIGPTTFWLPLALVLGISGAKDALEDFRRHQSDVEENGRVTEMWNQQFCEFEKVCWAEVTTGSLVRVRSIDDDTSPMIPCDIALLATSNLDGTCFLETVNLDGETNLKLRQAPEETQKELTVLLPKPGRDNDGGMVQEVKLESLPNFHVILSCSQPDAFLYEFNARMKVGETDEKDIALNGGSSGGQFLQRSTKLKNTTWILGIAVYTGEESKIQMNMSEPKTKVSNLERQLNRFIVMVFAFLFILCCAGGVGAALFMSSSELKEAWYLAPGISTPTFNVSSPGFSGLLSFFSFLILLSLLIPISLYVSVEFVKGFIAVIISSDRSMYVEEENLPSKARSAGLCEELGQVTYIFSDKTGTLTQNLMIFKKCSIAGVEYGRGFCEVERAIARRRGVTLGPDPAPPEGVDPGFQFVDERLLFCKWRELPEHDMIEMFLMNMALNHTVQVEVDSLRGTMPVFQAESPDEGAFVSAARNLGFYFCKRFMKEVTLRISSCDVGDGYDKVYYILNSNGFDNDRKRSSVIVRDSDGLITLFVKGADTSVMPFVDRSDCLYFTDTQLHLNAFGDQGLRTLVFAGRTLSEEEYEAWNADYQNASLLNEGREQVLRQLASRIEENHSDSGCVSALFDASTSYQQSLVLYGVSALEDKLQEDVGLCISQLAKAMIKIWVLTGDKLETAINIGFATALLTTEMEPLLRISQDEINNPQDGWQKNASALELKLHGLIQLVVQMEVDRLVVQLGKAQTFLQEEEQLFKNLIQNIRDVWEGSDSSTPAILTKSASLRKRAAKGGKKNTAKEQLKGMLASVESKLKEALMRERVRSCLVRLNEKTRKARVGGYALVIDGPCLRAALHPGNKLVFLSVAIRCKAVICCRVTPSQKAEITLLVKQNISNQITLAIGDGANDVSMIQAAHIGVGIRGKEGQQAVLAADYALPRFAFLERLLLVHGHYSYNRVATMMCYFFYKNIVFALTLFWFAVTNGFSAQPLYDDGYQALYNLVFTSLPVMTFAIFERDMEPYMLCARPELYSTGQTSKYFNSERFAMFVIGAMMHSLIIFYGTIVCVNFDIGNETGRGFGIWSVGTTILTNIIVVVTVVLCLNTRSWAWVHWLTYFGSIVIWMIFILIYHVMDPGYWGRFDSQDNTFFIIYELSTMLMFWIGQIGITLACVIPILVYKFFREHYDPGVDDYYRRVINKPHRYPADGHLVPKKVKESEAIQDDAIDIAAARNMEENMRSPSWTIADAQPRTSFESDRQGSSFGV